ncbi:MAG: hypothetical protein ACPHBM_01355 [Flavobacteriales bacterium]
MRTFFLSLFLAVAACATAQPLLVDGDVCLDVEVAVIHTEGPLAGLTTYHLYATLPGPADVVTTVFGDIEHPTALLTSTEWYQNENGGQFPCANNPLLFDLFPELEYDSWLTIGIDGPPDPTLGQDCPQVVMSNGSPFATEFENGQSFVIDDLIGSAWFVVPSNTNGLPDEDGRVLLAQLTTDGDLDGVLYMQVLPGGVGTLAQIMELPLYGECDEIALIDCPEAIEAVEYGGCEWGFEVSNFQAGEAATWTFGDDVVSGGHYAEYVFGGDGVYPVTVSFSSDVCPEGVTLETTVEVDGCSEPDCSLELLVDSLDNDSVIIVTPTGFPMDVELIYSLNGEVFQEGGWAMTLPYGIGNEPWQVCVQYVSEDCPDGVVACTGSEDYESGCPDEIWVGGAECEFIFSICDFTEGEQVFWEFSDSTTAEGHFTWHTFEENGWYEACATYVSPSCPDTTVLCTWVDVGDCACLEEEDAELMWMPDSTGDCSGWFLLEMMQPDGYSIFWDYGDGASETGYYLWSEHQYAESGTYEACATVTSPACPEGSTWCIEVVVEDCPGVTCELDIVVDWTDPEAGWALLIADGAPEGAVVEWFNEDGDLIATGEVADLVDVGGTVCAIYETPECPDGVEACVELEPWEPDEFDCDLDIEAVQEADGSWTLTAVTDSSEGDGFLWTLSDGSILNGQEINHTFAPGSAIETACVTATFWDCDEVLSACIDLENGGEEGCEEVEVTLDGETLAELLSGLEMIWTLYGDLFDLEGELILDPEEEEPGTLVLCLPPGCYGMSFDMQGVPGLDGLPGMTLSLEVGDEDEIEVDLSVLEGLIELEFGVMTDCGSVVLETGSPIGGLLLHPNPAESRLFVTWPEAAPAGGLTWRLRDAAGRIVSTGISPVRRWEVDLGSLAMGSYLLEVEGSAARQVGRVMVAR